jgi:hypothetical protein
MKLRTLDGRRGVPGRVGGAPMGGPAGGRGGMGGYDRGNQDRGGVFDRDGRGPMGDTRGELRRGGDLRGELSRYPAHHRGIPEAQRDMGEQGRSKAPHPWDPTPKDPPSRDRNPRPSKAVIQSAITKRGREDEEEADADVEDDDEVQRRKKRGRDDDEDEEEGEEAAKPARDDDDGYSGMRMDAPSAKLRRISAEGDRTRESHRASDNGRDDRRERNLRSPREVFVAAFIIRILNTSVIHVLFMYNKPFCYVVGYNGQVLRVEKNV